MTPRSGRIHAWRRHSHRADFPGSGSLAAILRHAFWDISAGNGPFLFLFSQTLETAIGNFWDMVWLMISTFFFVAYLIIAVPRSSSICSRTTNSAAAQRVLWVIGLIFIRCW